MLFLPMNVDVPMDRLPVANWLLIVIITCVSIVCWVNKDVEDALAGTTYLKVHAGDASGEINDAYRDRSVSRQEARDILEALRPTVTFDAPWYRLLLLAVTNVFVHGGLTHLIGNMIFLWVFGMH